MTYAQGVSSQIAAVGAIGVAKLVRLAVSSTQVLSSGVSVATAAIGSGLDRRTVRNILLAWVLTLPASMLLSAGLFGLAVWVMGV